MKGENSYNLHFDRLLVDLSVLIKIKISLNDGVPRKVYYMGLGVSKSTFSRLETGRYASVKTLLDASSYFGLSIEPYLKDELDVDKFKKDFLRAKIELGLSNKSLATILNVSTSSLIKVTDGLRSDEELINKICNHLKLNKKEYV